MSHPLVRSLNLAPHPEGGWFRETMRLPSGTSERGSMSAILFLLDSDDRSHWHRIDATELWIWNGGHPLTLLIHHRGRLEEHLIGPDNPQAIVPPNAWQAAEPRHGWALASCVVTPGFDFTKFELAPAGWQPE